MAEEKILGWKFHSDGAEGIPYLECPYCKRKVSGKEAIFMSTSLETCPTCGKKAHFDNIKEEDWLYIDSYYGDN